MSTDKRGQQSDTKSETGLSPKAKARAMLGALCGAFFITVEIDGVMLLFEKAFFDAYGISWSGYAYIATLLLGIGIGYLVFKAGYRSELQYATAQEADQQTP